MNWRRTSDERAVGDGLGSAYGYVKALHPNGAEIMPRRMMPNPSVRKLCQQREKDTGVAAYEHFLILKNLSKSVLFDAEVRVPRLHEDTLGTTEQLAGDYAIIVKPSGSGKTRLGNGAVDAASMHSIIAAIISSSSVGTRSARR